MSKAFEDGSILSTNLADGEGLEKINLWLSEFRGDEILKFHAARVTRDSIKLIIEGNRSRRLRIQASWPPHHSYLKATKTIPYIYVAFTEPVSQDSLAGNVLFQGTAIATGQMTLINEGHILKIDTSTLGTITTAGQYELIFTDILHYNKIWKLCGERKVIWWTSENGGTRGGEDSLDPDRRALQISKITIENSLTERQIMNEFYAQTLLDPADVVASQLVNGYPEYDKVTLLAIHKRHPKVPYVKCISPKYKACYFQDAAPPDEMKIEIGFTEAVTLSYLSGRVYFDEVQVADNKMFLSQAGYLLTLLVTPTAYKHHCVLISGMQSENFIRSWPFFSSFVIHKETAGTGGATTLDELDDVIITTPSINNLLIYNGSDWVNDDLVIALNDLSDVSITTPATNAVLLYDGINWVDGALPLHNTTHQLGGTDPIKLDDLAVPDDNTDLDSSTTSHGLLRKLSNVATEFLNGQGAWAVPASSGAPTTTDYLVKTADAALSAERVVTDTTSITVDWATAGQAKFQRAALTGDVTASANSNSTTIANGAVSLAKMANLANGRIIGRYTASTGVPEAITISSANFDYTGGNLTIKDAGVPLAKMADLANGRIIGRSTASTGVPEAITLNSAHFTYTSLTLSLKQGAAIADATDAASAITQLNLLLARCRAGTPHIAT